MREPAVLTWLEDIERVIVKATKAPWTGKGNLPFYAELDKPAPSMSKHDDKRPTYWRVEDVKFVLYMRNEGVSRLIDEVKKLRKAIRTYIDDKDTGVEGLEEVLK